MLRTPTTYLLPVTVISPAMCVEAMMISAPLNSLLYSPTAQLFTVWSIFDWDQCVYPSGTVSQRYPGSPQRT